MEKKKMVVSCVKCASYKPSVVDGALKKAIKLIEGDECLKKGRKVLIKPNLVTAVSKNPEATITNVSLVEAMCKILQEKKCKIFIGESSFMDTDDSFNNSGISAIAKKYNAKIVIFEQDKLVKIRDKNAKILKQFPVAKTLREVDVLIDMPKLKTHVLTQFTGAIKNLYGVIPGGLKQRYHKRGKKDKNFSKILADIYQNLNHKIKLVVMDAVIGMEGEGPTSGKPKKVGIILASKNAVALDIASIKLIGMNPRKIHTIKEVVSRKLYPSYNFDLVGMDSLPIFNFEKPTPGRKVRSSLKRLFAGEPPIVCDEKKCIKCGKCGAKCPMKAITLKPFPIIDKKKCIRCFCCIEICPQNALGLKG